MRRPSKNRLEIDFRSGVKLSPALRSAILTAAEAAARRSGRMGISVVGPAKMRALNSQYRKKDRPTDVLAFPGVLPAIPDEIGDVVLCLAVARRQAKDYGGTLKEELQRLTVHGVLHLFGYDHETSERDAKRMFALQEKILRGL